MAFLGSPSYQNPANSAMPYLNQVPGTITPYYQPYINAGNQSLSDLMGQYSQLLNNPQDRMNQIGSGYQQSPGYQFQMNQAMNATDNAAASGGMLGTPYHQQNAATMAGNVANQDYYNYLGQALGLYSQGLQGSQGMTNLGYGASNELAQSLANNLGSQGSLAYQGAANQNQANGNKYNAQMGLLGTLGGAALSFF